MILSAKDLPLWGTKLLEPAHDEVIEQSRLLDMPETMVSMNYENDAAKPMPVMLGWLGQRDRKIAELTEHLPAPQGMIITEELPPMQPVMAELVDRGCALVSFQNSKPEPRPWPKGKAKWVWPTPDPAHVDGSDEGVGRESMGELKIEGIYPLAYLRMLAGA